MAAARKPAKTIKKAKQKKVPGPKKSVRKTPKSAGAPRQPVKKKDAVWLVVEKAKFSHPEPAQANAPLVLRQNLSEDLPAHYGIDRIVLQIRDPWWMFAWWEAGAKAYEKIQHDFGGDLAGARKILRVYDVTGIEFHGDNALNFFDININDHVQSWYIKGGPGRSWCVALGLLLRDGRFATLLRSNIVSTPLDSPSSQTDEEWMVPEELFMRLYRMGQGLKRGSPSKGWQTGIGWASMTSPGKRPGR